jgi:chromosome partitioning protein
MSNKKSHIIAFCNQKGGVAKTTSAINVGGALKILNKNLRVLLVDLDPQGNLTSCLFRNKEFDYTMYHVYTGEKTLKQIIQKHQGFDVSPADIEISFLQSTVDLGNYFILKEQLETIKDDYNYILIDCPPSLGIFTIGACIAADQLIVPVTCETMSLKGLVQLLKTHEDIKMRHNPDLEIMGVLFTKHDKRQKIDNQVLSMNLGELKRFNNYIRKSVKLIEYVSSGSHVHDYAPGSRASMDYLNVTKEVLQYG